MSVKRPKKWKPAVANSKPTSSTLNIPHTPPEVGSLAIRNKNKLSLTLSPMRNATPVPRDSHLVHTSPAIDSTTMTHPNTIKGEEIGEVSASTSWVGRKVDALFSPVLSFLQHGSAGSSNSSGGGKTLPKEELGASRFSQEALFQTDNGDIRNTNSLVDVDGDVTMEVHVAERKSLHADAYEDNEKNVYEQVESLDDEEDDFNPYLFIKCLPPYQHAIPPNWTSRPKALPPLDYAVLPPICLVLDLDETLVHCTVEPISDADMIFPVEFNGIEYKVHVRCRPFLREFLEAVHEKFEVVIFTASQQVYADKLLDKIDPEGKFICHRLFRDSCLPIQGNFLKDLTILGRDLSKAVIVDNSPHAFGYQMDNGIPIESWFDDPADMELLKLESFLRTLHGVDDVRNVLRKIFQTQQLVLNA